MTSNTEGPFERFERLAAEFYRDTGIMAPGKDQPAGMGGSPSLEERCAAWDKWHEERQEKRVKPAQNVCETCGGEKFVGLPGDANGDEENAAPCPDCCGLDPDSASTKGDMDCHAKREEE